jgi:hypothetical protein
MHKFLPTLLAAALLAGCGGGGGGGDGQAAEPLTVLAVAPPTGPVAGGTQLAIQGTGFLDPDAGLTIVTLDNAPAAAVNVVSDTQILATTPPGTVGVRDVTVSNDTGAATLDSSFTYVPPPALTQVQADQTRSGIPAGLTSGGTRITLIGGRFQVNNPGVTQVTVNGVPATDIVIQDDFALECTTPPGLPGIVSVEVSNDNGSASIALGFFYRAPLLYAADGKNVSGNLYLIDPSNGLATPIGSGIGHVVEGLAMAPDGTLWGVTEGFLAPTSQLITINTTTGVGTVVATLLPSNSSSTRADIRDIEFVGDRLFGMANNFRRPCEIDLVTGAVFLFEFTDFGTGEGVAHDVEEDEILYAVQENDDDLWVFDPVTGVSAPVQSLAGTGLNSFFNAMTFLDGVLYASEAQRNTTNNTEPNGTSKLVVVNPASGSVTLVGSLLDDIDALAGNFKR